MAGSLAPPWSPRQRKIAARNARVRRLMRAGILKPLTKDQAREACGALPSQPRRTTLAP